MKETILFILIILFSLVNCMAQELIVQNLRPSVVKTFPQCGDLDVNPDIATVTVTFSKDMMTDRMWSWCSVSKESFPEIDQSGIRYLIDKRTCILPVKLEPDKTYVIWINSEKYMAFKDLNQQSAYPYQLVFKTASGENNIKGHDPIDCAVKWLKLIDNKSYSTSWDTASTVLKSKISLSKWENAMASVGKQFGKTLSRSFKSKKYYDSLPGMPDGKYCVIQFISSFENKKSAVETVIPMIDKDGQWWVSGYNIK